MARLAVTAAVALALTAGAVWNLPALRVDNTVEVWLPGGSAGLRDLHELQARFGDDGLLLAYLEGDGLAEQGDAWRELLAAVRATPGVARALAPPFVEEAAGNGPAAPLRYFLASEDGRHAALAVIPAAGLPVAERSRLVERLEGVLAAAGRRLGVFHLAGADVITHDLDTGSRASLRTLAPLVVGVMALLLYAATREAAAAAVAFLNAGLATVWALGLMALAGRPLTLVAATLPAILAVVGVVQTLHLVARYHAFPAPADAAPRARREDWWREAVRSTLRPALLCAATTAAGFASLATSQIPPLRDLGIFAAAGVVFSFLLGVTLTPALLAAFPGVLPRGAATHGWWSEARAASYTGWIRRRAAVILGVAALAMALALAGVARLRAESHILEFFPGGHRIPVNYRAIERNLLALTPLELVVDGRPEALLADRSLDSYRSLLEAILREEPLARQVVSVLLEPARGPRLEFAVPPAELRQALEREGLPEEAGPFVRFADGRYFVRTTLLAATASSNEIQRLVERLRVRIAAALPAGVTAKVTGSAALVIEGQVLLLRTQIQSFAVALAAILLLVLPGFRSWRVAAVLVPPNVLPIAVTLGGMGYAGIPLDTATVTVAGIALGIVFDNTIHLVHRTLAVRAAGEALEPALARALWEAGPPAAVAGLVLAAGFAVFAFAPFRPTAYLGLLVAATSFTGLVCDLVLLPVMVMLLPRFLPADRIAAAE